MHVNDIPYYHDQHDAIGVIWCITVKHSLMGNATCSLCPRERVKPVLRTAGECLKKVTHVHSTLCPDETSISNKLREGHKEFTLDTSWVMQKLLIEMLNMYV